MGRVLTEQEVITTGGFNPYYVNYDRYKCCTRARAEALNCTVTDPSNAANNQLVCGVSKTHNYVLTVPNKVSDTLSANSVGYTITSTKDGVGFYGVSVYSKSSNITKVTIKPQVNGTTALILVTFNSSNTSGYVTFIQDESGLPGTTNINS